MQPIFTGHAALEHVWNQSNGGPQVSRTLGQDCQSQDCMKTATLPLEYVSIELSSTQIASSD